MPSLLAPPQRRPDGRPAHSPLVIAHRGAWSATVAENSLHAVRAAVARGYDGVEVDLRCTRDGAIVLMHDSDPARTTIATARRGPAPIEHSDLADVRRLRLPTPAGPEPVPTLAEVLSLTAPRGVLTVLDVKAPHPSGLVWPRLRAELATLSPAARAALIVQGRQPDELRRLATALPGIRTSLLLHRGPRSDADTAGTWALSRLACTAPRRVVRRDHEAGYRVLAWTVNDPVQMRRAIRCGVDGIITDRPARLRELLGAPVAGRPPATA